MTLDLAVTSIYPQQNNTIAKAYSTSRFTDIFTKYFPFNTYFINLHHTLHTDFNPLAVYFILYHFKNIDTIVFQCISLQSIPIWRFPKMPDAGTSKMDGLMV